MLENSTVLITGANGGIGSKIVQDFMKCNVKLILIFNKQRNIIDEIISKCGNNSNIKVIQIDLSKSEEIDNKLDEIIQNENVDIFIHSVTPEIIHKKIEECNWEDFQNHIDIQTKSFYKITQKIIPKMKQMKKGKIITILSSYVVGRPPSMISPYIVAKYSQLGLVKTFAVELGKYGITTNAISPSMTETVLIDKLPKKLKEFEVMDNPSKRLGNTSDIVSLVTFLCSDEANYMNGQNFLLTGGKTMH